MFDGQRILYVPLLEIEHPFKTIRFCDGGFFDWPGRGTFASSDDTFGVLGSLEASSESLGDEAPGGRFTILPPNPAAAVLLAQANAQGAPIRMWLAEANPDSGALIGTPDMVFSGMLDTVTITIGKSVYEVSIEYVSEAEKLFLNNEANVLSQSFHQRAWPGELGFARTTGTILAVPWGVSGAARGAYYGGGGGGGITPAYGESEAQN